MRFDGGDPANWTIIPLRTQRNILLDGVGEYDGTYWLGSQHFGVIRKKPDSDLWVPANGDITPYSELVLRYFDGYLFVNNLVQSFSPDNGATWQQRLNNTFPVNTWRNGNYDYRLGGNAPATPVLRCLRNQRFEWEPYTTSPGYTVAMTSIGDTLLGLSSTMPFQLFQSFNNGASWTTIPAPLGNVFFVSRQGKFYAVKDSSVYRTDDAGVSWQAIYTFPYVIDATVGKFYLLHDTMLISNPARDLIFYSADGGQTFDTLPAPQNPNTDVFHMRVWDGFLVLYMGDGIWYYSKDAGKTWVGVTPPASVDPLAAIENGFWTYGDNTLFLAYEYWKLRLDDQRQVSGKVFLDLNGNGQRNIGEPGLNQFTVQAGQSAAMSATYNNGDFSLLLGAGADELSVGNVPPNFAVSPASVAVPAGGSSIPAVSFAIQPQGTVHDAVVHLTAAKAFRAGYDNTLYVHLKNAGTVPSSGQLKLVLNPLLTPIAVTPAADEQNGDTLIWNYANLALLGNRKFQVSVGTAVVPPGTPVFIGAEALSGPDAEPANNIAVLDEQIVSSYDPNDKTVSATHVPVADADGEELVYTIRFQNLGNTATDFITVRDTLSEALDAASVRVLAASHFYTWAIEDGRVLVFRFNPIALSPAAVDSLNSQGFVQFSARLKPGLGVGDDIANTAYIYFDFNPAVVTNTVVTSIEVVSTFVPARRAQRLDIFPNPAVEQVTLRLPEGLSGSGRIEVFSVEGKLAYSALSAENAQNIPLADFVSGAYWCRWTRGKQVFWGKMVVQR